MKLCTWAFNHVQPSKKAKKTFKISAIKFEKKNERKINCRRVVQHCPHELAS